MEKIADIIIVGGGISGVTCAQTVNELNPDVTVILITASPLIKTVVNFKQVTERIESFQVEEKNKSYLEVSCINIEVIDDVVTEIQSENHILFTENGMKMKYKKLCLCTGGRPKVISEYNPYVLGIRDTESVQEFQKRLKNAKRIVVVGNGGIATELVYEIEGCEVIWAIKDKSIANTFVDAGAAQFFLPSINKDKTKTHEPLKRHKYTITDEETANRTINGGALGPDWSLNLTMVGLKQDSHKVHIEYNVEVNKILTAAEMLSSECDKWPVYIELSNGKVYGSDVIVSATGVIPNSQQLHTDKPFDIGEDGGIKVNDKMETNIMDIYGAGDICSANWKPSKHWLQMRLWSQARQMGCYAAKSMLADLDNEEITLDFCFELFTHMTKFFNYKVILLGKFNGQNLGENQEILLRMTEGVEYIKLILQDSRLQGAILIGETDLEETFENLILNETDLTLFKDQLLNPGIDIEDFFD
ncbi:hypothetical protein LOTGIDRAFT_178551 [Lottia gigantea]|uniref:Pyridine nucleotide-disulfide oxidoreductase domain-containing protein 1 n=1 Tax=Lottia gigantea TaxID=225164 RepID=V4AIJ9_LOTGI|nr:hypothetical protein LOTGIDRAFT_178551 [Lottia gigantea]ESO93306.1 hypothetical protein LOTGIDRAFT_178551 [Lottia gigantea]